MVSNAGGRTTKTGKRRIRRFSFCGRLLDGVLIHPERPSRGKQPVAVLGLVRLIGFNCCNKAIDRPMDRRLKIGYRLCDGLNGIRVDRI